MADRGGDGVSICAVVPTYQNPQTIRAVTEAIRAHGLEVIVVDDGSDAPGRDACAALAREGSAQVEHLPVNRGKGGAVKRGFELAHARGFSHVFQIDADGQHDLERIPAFVEAARARPEAMVLGMPEYDASAPRVRRIARGFSQFWVGLSAGFRTKIGDAMIGFRVYPLAEALAARARTDGMDFDVELVVLLARAGVPAVNLTVGIRYLSEEEGGVSHFRLVRDNVKMSVLHSRLCTSAMFRWFGRRFVRPVVGRR